MVFSILSEEQIKKFDNDWELDFSYSIHGIARFRGNIMKQRGTLSAAFRTVPYEIPNFDELGLPKEIKKLCDLSNGLVLVTGLPARKSTTPALIDIINKNMWLLLLWKID